MTRIDRSACSGWHPGARIGRGDGQTAEGPSQPARTVARKRGQDAPRTGCRRERRLNVSGTLRVPPKSSPLFIAGASSRIIHPFTQLCAAIVVISPAGVCGILRAFLACLARCLVYGFHAGIWLVGNRVDNVPRIAAALGSLLLIASALGVNVARYSAVWEMAGGCLTRATEAGGEKTDDAGRGKETATAVVQPAAAAKTIAPPLPAVSVERPVAQAKTAKPATPVKPVATLPKPPPAAPSGGTLAPVVAAKPAPPPAVKPAPPPAAKKNAEAEPRALPSLDRVMPVITISRAVLAQPGASISYPATKTP
jgi:hypothetical protein